MTEDQNILRMREYPIVLWVIGGLMIISGMVFLVLSPQGWIAEVIDLALGLVFLLLPKALTLTADRVSQMLTLNYRGLLWSTQKEIPLQNVAGVELQSSHDSEGSTTYRIAIIGKDDKAIPFHSYYSSGYAGKQKKVEQLRSFLGIKGGDGPALGGLTDALQIIQQQFKEQETSTGSQAEDHLTEGVHWRLQTVSFGAASITHWFSPDATFPGGFLLLNQKPGGQKIMAGGVGKFLYQQSLKFYGFAPEDTPGLDSAEVMQPLDASLEPYFSAFTSDPASAQRLMNPWFTAPVGDWATRYPLKTIQREQLFGQLVVLLSPRGIYIANMSQTSPLIPEAVDELTNLGIQLVKAL
jgi:hypothetical protein